MRTHTTFGTPDQEPWSLRAALRGDQPPRHRAALRAACPQIYNGDAGGEPDGLPALRPLLLEYPDDPATYGMPGRVPVRPRPAGARPCCARGATEREVYLPAGDLVRLLDSGGTRADARSRCPSRMDAILVFVRGGAFVFRQPVVQHTGEMAGQTLQPARLPPPTPPTVPNTKTTGTASPHQRGSSLRRRFTAQAEGGRWTLQAAAPEGLLPSGRTRPRGGGARAGGAAVGDWWERERAGPRRRRAAGPRRARGWRRTDDGALLVRTRDRFEAFSITVAPAERGREA